MRKKYFFENNVSGFTYLKAILYVLYQYDIYHYIFDIMVYIPLYIYNDIYTIIFLI